MEGILLKSDNVAGVAIFYTIRISPFLGGSLQVMNMGIYQN